MSKTQKLTFDELLASQCSACPLFPNKPEELDEIRESRTAADIVIFNTKDVPDLTWQLDDLVPGEIVQEFLVECESIGAKKDKTAITCCSGRKLATIQKLKPKLVISIGSTFIAIEQALGHASTRSEYVPLPSKTGDHVFWHLHIPKYKNIPIKKTLESASYIIERCLVIVPQVFEPDDSGIEYITTIEEAKEAFEWLFKQPYTAFDIETTGLYPYVDDFRILSIAIGTNERTYAFPLWHPQTPSTIDPAVVLSLFLKLCKNTQMIAHNVAFELLCLAHLCGQEFMWHNKDNWHCTQAQSHLLSTAPKKLDAAIRREFGHSLKSMSDVDVKNLKETAINLVLQYNARDTKSTYNLFFQQQKAIEAQNLEVAYRMQVERIPGVIAMQLRGICPNPEFAQEESRKLQPRMAAYVEKFREIPEVKALEEVKGNPVNPASNKDLQRLFHEYYNVPTSQTSFDEEHLNELNIQPVCGILLKYRDVAKQYSTYILPLNTLEEGGGDCVYSDGLIHPQINTMGTITGRFSAERLNVQNYPESLRDIFKAYPGEKLLQLDFGQIEARAFSSLTRDLILISSICDPTSDVHQYWADRLIEKFPHLTDGSEEGRKAFRKKVKSNFVFALAYGAGVQTVAKRMNLTPEQIQPVVNEFWQQHKALKEWQKQLVKEHNEQHRFVSPFGRIYRAPLFYNQILNFTAQGAASDILVNAQTKLCYMSWTMKRPELTPIINVHDSLVFSMSEESIEELMPFILRTLLDVSSYKEWLKVPLTIEAAIGDTLGSMEKIATYTSTDWCRES
jgi:DNA polymerase I